MKKINYSNSDLELTIEPKINLAKSFKYYDDFDDRFIIFDSTDDDRWEIICTGDKKFIKFDKYPQNLKLLLKVVVIKILKNLTPETAISYTYDLYHTIKIKNLINILQCHPHQLRIKWEELKYDHIFENRNQLNHSLSFIKQILLYLCEKNQQLEFQRL